VEDRVLQDNQVRLLDGDVYTFGPVGIGWSRKITEAGKDGGDTWPAMLDMVYVSLCRGQEAAPSRDVLEHDLLSAWNINAVIQAIAYASGQPKTGEALPA
jgi:hypothetical protein